MAMTSAFFQQARFAISANDWEGLPADEGVEVAFAGRSNAGKSSAINALTQQSRLAFTSKMPGRTQMINFFALDEQRMLVDLPGYGYAQVPLALKQRWQRFLSDYLVSRRALRGLVLLMDIRHPLMELDRQLIDWYLPRAEPLVILLTKADKLPRGRRVQAVREVRSALAAGSGSGAPCAEIIPFSSVSREGVELTQQAIERLFYPLDSEPEGLMG